MILLVRVVKRILDHPFNKRRKASALFRFVKWQLYSLFSNSPVVYNFTEDSKLIVKKGVTGATGNLYCGLLEFPEMGFVLHYLRESDLFVDVGANIGSYTILASAQNKATSIALEPIPQTFKGLMANVAANDMANRVEALNVGVGSKAGKLKFTNQLGAINHVATKTESNTIEVPVVTLDELLSSKNPALLKVDVEGFETEVIRGASGTLDKTSLKAIIIELNGLGNRYGYSDEAIDQLLIDKGFTRCTYDPFSRTLTKLDGLGDHNTIYVRDLPHVEDRLKSAPRVGVAGVKL